MSKKLDLGGLPSVTLNSAEYHRILGEGANEAKKKAGRKKLAGFVDIGTYSGTTAGAVAFVASPKHKVFTVNCLKKHPKHAGENLTEIALGYWKSLGLNVSVYPDTSGDVVRIDTSSTTKALSIYNEMNIPLYFVHYRGATTPEALTSELTPWLDVMVDGGVLVICNYNQQDMAVKDFLKTIKKSHKHIKVLFEKL